MKEGFLEILLPFAIILLLFGFSSQKASTTAQPSPTPAPEIPSFSEEDENLYEVTFIITSVPEDTPEDASIYMMGNFNNWLVGDENYRFDKMEDGTYQLTLRMPPNTEIEYKYNLGNYDYIEKDFFGNERENRTYKFEYNFDEVRNEIESW
ncbi:hypothetical protein [Petrotoga sp. SL27]|uniref:hypothetical protein n=1 Tax=Petrotoga sp. SL27 TaxID=1445612 RepID=UPI000CDE8937|nr:hypothetical protein [Petrotoga sp. SL27]POZ90904.1 hypothetical protein AD60_04960 [Petrotoga sp. SL27]